MYQEDTYYIVFLKFVKSIWKVRKLCKNTIHIATTVRIVRRVLLEIDYSKKRFVRIDPILNKNFHFEKPRQSSMNQSIPILRNSSLLKFK